MFQNSGIAWDVCGGAAVALMAIYTIAGAE